MCQGRLLTIFCQLASSCQCSGRAARAGAGEGTSSGRAHIQLREDTAAAAGARARARREKKRLRPGGAGGAGARCAVVWLPHWPGAGRGEVRNRKEAEALTRPTLDITTDQAKPGNSDGRSRIHGAGVGKPARPPARSVRDVRPRGCAGAAQPGEGKRGGGVRGQRLPARPGTRRCLRGPHTLRFTHPPRSGLVLSGPGVHPASRAARRRPHSQHDPGDVQSHRDTPVFEGSGDEAAEGERRHHAQREGEQ